MFQRIASLLLIFVFLFGAGYHATSLFLKKTNNDDLASLLMDLSEEGKGADEDGQEEKEKEKESKHQLKDFFVSGLMQQFDASGKFGFYHDYLIHFSSGDYSGEIFSPPESTLI